MGDKETTMIVASNSHSIYLTLRVKKLNCRTINSSKIISVTNFVRIGKPNTVALYCLPMMVGRVAGSFGGVLGRDEGALNDLW